MHIFPLQNLKIFYTGTREFDNVLAICLSEIPFHFHNSEIRPTLH